MLRNVLENWIDSLGEREFDLPFISLLRGMGFFDIHFTHGPFEFGKDFIAKCKEDGRVYQYGFQTKAGDMGGGDWKKTLGQIEELVGAWIGHPNFDKSLPRECRLVITGRLKGNAGVSAQAYASRLHDRGEGRFEVWEKSNLLDFLEGSDPRQEAFQLSDDTKRLIARTDTGDLSVYEVEKALSESSPTKISEAIHLHEPMVESSLLQAHHIASGRVFESLAFGAHTVRLAAVSAYSQCFSRDASVEIISDSLAAFFSNCERLIDETPIFRLFATDLALASGGISAIVAYPALCLRTIEYIGLLGIWQYQNGEMTKFRSIADRCRDFVEEHPGTTKPISDRFATSLPPAVITLHLAGHHDSVDYLLRETTKWVCDRYEYSESGLASPYSSPKEEIEALLGAPFEFVHLQDRSESTLAVALADLAYCFHPGLFPDIINDLKAVEVVPSVIHPEDSMDSMFLSRGGTTCLLNINYPDTHSNRMLEHHSLQPAPRILEEVGGIVLPLVVSTVVRDRLFSDCYPRVPFLKQQKGVED